jgi:drug/metabolite transporter (DMT)-like permease
VTIQTTEPVRDEEPAGPSRRPGLVAWGCLVIVYIVWGSTYLAIRVGVETMPPLMMAAARNLIAGLILFPIALRSARSATHRRPMRREWLGCAVVGVLLLGANGVVGIAEQSVPSGLTALLIATVPLWLLGLDAALNRTRLGLAPSIGLALGLAGVALLSGLGHEHGSISVAGVLLVMSASAGEFGRVHPAAISARSWLALGYLVVFGSIVAFSAYGIAVRTLPTATVATYAYVNPVIAVLLGSLILNERLTPAMIGGGVLIVGAVVLVVRRRPPPH